RQCVFRLSRHDERTDDGHRRDGVRQRHQRRVQQAGDAADDVHAQEGGEHEHEESRQDVELHGAAILLRSRWARGALVQGDQLSISRRVISHASRKQTPTTPTTMSVVLIMAAPRPCSWPVSESGGVGVDGSWSGDRSSADIYFNGSSQDRTTAIRKPAVPTVAAVPVHMRMVSALSRPPIFAMTQKPLSFIQL